MLREWQQPLNRHYYSTGCIHWHSYTHAYKQRCKAAYFYKVLGLKNTIPTCVCKLNNELRIIELKNVWNWSFFHPPHEAALSLLVHNRDESCFHLSLAPVQPPTVFGSTLNARRIQKSPGHTEPHGDGCDISHSHTFSFICHRIMCATGDEVGDG